MAVVQAFRALRYDLGQVGVLGDVVAPPYDVIDATEQDALYQRHPANVVRLILNRSEPGDASPQDKYDRAARFLHQWRQEGILQLDPQPALYFYQQLFELDGQARVRSGFMGRVRLEPLGDGTIFPHEETHAAAKADRMHLMQSCHANLSPVFSIYPDDEDQIGQWLAAAVGGTPPVEARDAQGVVHRLWAITNSAVIGRVTSAMASKPLFIADGHHRYETALNYLYSREAREPLPPDHPARYIMMMNVGMSDPGMVVLPTHRLFRGLPPITSDQLAERLQGCFSTRVVGEGPDAASAVWDEIEVAGNQNWLGLFSAQDHRWLMAELTAAGEERMSQLAQDHGPDWRELGVSILHRLVIDELLQASDLPKPMYVHSIPEVVHHIQAGDAVGRDATGQEGSGKPFSLVALVMPATLEHIRKISQAGERMPAKSTYFYPKLLSGLIFHMLS